MVFSSIIFVFIFLPITLFIYYICDRKYRNIVLLVFSLLFYAYGERQFVYIMIGFIFLNYWLALGIEKYFQYKNYIFILSIIVNLGLLFIYKYLGFILTIFNDLFSANIQIKEIILPIGISFFTFQSLSYVIDVYRGKVKAQHNFINIALYIVMFPQLIAGPIVRYSTIEAQIEKRKLILEDIGEGCKRFIQGFCKKILLANNLSIVAEHYFSLQCENLSIAGSWIGSICFSLQIFYDFSGYSDMAIGLGKILGFSYEENFNYPYISKSISEFWRRWHISLGNWFRDYIYIPLGGSHTSIPKNIMNLGIVWFLTGIWHGANYNFVLWGVMYFVALILEKYIIKPEQHNHLFSFFYRIIIILYVNFCWVIFNSPNMQIAINYLKTMIGIYSDNIITDPTCYQMLHEYGIYILSGILLATPLFSYIVNKTISPPKNYIIKRYIFPFIYIIGFLWAVSFLILGSHNPFIYFNF